VRVAVTAALLLPLISWTVSAVIEAGSSARWNVTLGVVVDEL
jgi:hypothetical protein